MSGTAGLDLNVLYGASPPATFGAANPVLALRQAEAGQAKAVAAQAKTPQVQRDIAAFRAAVAGAKDPRAVLANPTALRVLLTANGLADQAGYPALATKALMSNPSDSKSLANTLSDKRWKPAAATYAFATQGLAVLRRPDVLDTVSNAYAEISWRKSLDQGTPGLSDALTFRATAARAKNVDDVLGDPTLRRVVTGALGIPQQIAFQSLGAQEKAITSRMDVTRLQDPKFVEQMAQRYLIAQAGTASPAATGLDALAVQAGRGGLVV